jgi:hypothetical protein
VYRWRRFHYSDGPPAALEGDGFSCLTTLGLGQPGRAGLGEWDPPEDRHATLFTSPLLRISPKKLKISGWRNTPVGPLTRCLDLRGALVAASVFVPALSLSPPAQVPVHDSSGVACHPHAYALWGIL